MELMTMFWTSNDDAQKWSLASWQEKFDGALYKNVSTIFWWWWQLSEASWKETFDGACDNVPKFSWWWSQLSFGSG